MIATPAGQFISPDYSASVNDSGWAALGAAIAAGELSPHVVVPPGVYAVSAPIWTAVTGFTIEARGAGFVVTSSSTAPAVRFDDCSNFTVRGLEVAYDSVAGGRNAASHGIRLDRCSRFALQSVTVTSSRGVGIGLRDCDRFTIADCSISDTLADGVYMRDGSRRGLVTGNTLANTGDDGITVASYLSHATPCEAVSVFGNRVDQSASRGIIANGGRRIVITNNVVVSSFRAGILLASESSFGGFHALEDVQVHSNTITDYATGNDTNRAGVMVASGSDARPTTDISIKNNRITYGFGAGVAVNASTGSTPSTACTRVVIAGNEIRDAGDDGINVQRCHNPLIQANTITGTGNHGVYVENTCTGVASVRDNIIRDGNTSAGPTNDGINVRAPSCVIFGNEVYGSAFERDIEATVPTSGLVRDNWTPDNSSVLNVGLTT
jgi:parallel beta-helix repeat protein